MASIANLTGDLVFRSWTPLRFSPWLAIHRDVAHDLYWHALVHEYAHGLHLHAGWLLAFFAVGVVAINFGRWDEWGADGFRLDLTQAIMQTTLFDFGWVLLIVTLFRHHDARRHDLSYWGSFPPIPSCRRSVSSPI